MESWPARSTAQPLLQGKVWLVDDLTVIADLRSASRPESIRTSIRLWLPDEQSAWGNRLKYFFRLIGRKKISIPAGLTFAKLRGILTLGGRPQTVQIDRWPMAFGHIMPTTVLERLTDRLPRPNAVRAFISRRSAFTCCIVVNDRETPVACGRRLVNRRRGEAFHHMLIVTPAHQRHRLGSQMLANAVALYNQLGISRISLVAGLSAGGAVWPKYGFRPVSQKEWKKTHKRIRRNLAQLDASVKQQYSRLRATSLEAEVERLLGSSSPASIWGVCDLNCVGVAIPNWEYGLGAYLLQETRWRGILCLDDADAQARLYAYLTSQGVWP